MSNAQVQVASPADGSARHVYCSWHLRLSGARTEAQFWDSPMCLGALTFTDTLHALYVLVLNSVLFIVFKMATTESLQTHVRVLTVIFMAVACYQLFWITIKPHNYQRYRHMVALANRLLRLVCLAQTAVALSPGAIRRLAAAIPGMAAEAYSYNVWYASSGCSSSSADSSLDPGAHAAVLAAAASTGQQQQEMKICTVAPSSLGDWLPLIRVVMMPAVVYFGHAHVFLPFHIVLPLQLVTCALTLVPVRLRACWISSVEVAKLLAVPGCEVLSGVMSVANTAMAFTIGGTFGDAGSGCQGPVKSSVILIAFTHIVLLVLVPCCVVYCMEWSLKSKFVESQQMVMVGPAVSGLPLLLHLVLGLTVISTVWVLCEVVVSMLHLTCDAGG